MKPLLAQLQSSVHNGLAIFDFHLHTQWTDGAHTVQEMYDAATRQGLQNILFSEHARATSHDWFPRFAAEVRALPTTPCHASVGVETKIAALDGSLDLCDLIIGEVDLIMASVHRFPGESGEIRHTQPISAEAANRLEYELSMAALENPLVDILGHPFAMTLKRFKGIPRPEWVTDVMKKAAEKGVAFEINAHYHPDPKQWLAQCLALGTPVSLGSNAHDIDSVGALQKQLAV